jgi:hypothetical protein
MSGDRVRGCANSRSTTLTCCVRLVAMRQQTGIRQYLSGMHYVFSGWPTCGSTTSPGERDPKGCRPQGLFVETLFGQDWHNDIKLGKEAADRARALWDVTSSAYPQFRSYPEQVLEFIAQRSREHDPFDGPGPTRHTTTGRRSAALRRTAAQFRILCGRAPPDGSRQPTVPVRARRK